MSINKVQKSSKLFCCKICDYISSRQSQYIRHLSTDKHKNKDLAINSNQLSMIKSSNKLMCVNCKKTYKDNSGLWRHKKICFVENKDNEVKENEVNKDNLIEYLMKENMEMKNLVLQVCQKVQPTQIIHNNTNTNSHNKTFNLNIFLNEECKDAMNIMDFVDSLKLQLEDLENIGKTGFVDGISNIIVKNLKALDVNKRPVHCSDIKREVLYVKDENKWEKENEEHNKMQKVIHQITHKNIKQIPEWVNENPLCKDSSSIKNDEYMKLLSNSMSGDGLKEQKTNMHKIISKIAKEVIIEKD